ncbi:MAG: phosphate acyltransferase PlsX [Deltaproteobacteria bacterium]|nr:phosphate acyltransferase PlsX [Deltaproteobacteria bacterium]
MVIAVDAMGGDLYPKIPVLGAIKAVNEKQIQVVLVGDEPSIKKELENCKYDAKLVDIVHATQVIDMDENVASALRSKKDSSMRVCYNLHRDGVVQGVVSAGHSGAMLAIGKFVLKTIKGIDRPCISAMLPTLREDDRVLLVDAGANMDCTPEHLLQFAILGDVYMEHIHRKENPRIGLLNVGAEEGKGDERSKKAYELLKKCPLNFVGNIEGKEFFNGDVEIVVTDGFAGNILLKSVQGAANFVKEIISKEIKSSQIAKIGAVFLNPVFKSVKKKTNYAEYGGAPLLGLRGNGIVCHGKSNQEALLFGINFANWAAEAHLVERMEEKLVEYKEYLNS